MYRVIERRMIVPNLHEFTVEAPAVAETVQAGNFVIVRPDEYGERIPLPGNHVVYTMGILEKNSGCEVVVQAQVRDGFSYKGLPLDKGNGPSLMQFSSQGRCPGACTKNDVWRMKSACGGIHPDYFAASRRNIQGFCV